MHGRADLDLTADAIIDPESMAGLAYAAWGPLEEDIGEGCQFDACESEETCTCQLGLDCGCEVDECACQ